MVCDNVCFLGSWNTWSFDGTCSVTCGEGIQTLVRRCFGPEPKYESLACETAVGSGIRQQVDTKTKSCNVGACTGD